MNEYLNEKKKEEKQRKKREEKKESNEGHLRMIPLRKLIQKYMITKIEI